MDVVHMTMPFVVKMGHIVVLMGLDAIFNMDVVFLDFQIFYTILSLNFMICHQTNLKRYKMNKVEGFLSNVLCCFNFGFRID